MLSVRTRKIARPAIWCGVLVSLLLINLKADGVENNFRARNPEKLPLKVADVIESAQILKDGRDDPVLLSPDGKRYLIILVRGDLRRNGSWVELLSGSAVSLKAAARVRVVVRLFSKSGAQTRDLIKNVRWLVDSAHVAFLWDDGRRPPRIVSVDVRTGQLRTLAEHVTPILRYDLSGDGQTILFAAESQQDRRAFYEMQNHGFAVTDQSIWALLEHDYDRRTPRLRYEMFVLSRAHRLPRKVAEPEPNWLREPEMLQTSPNGRFAIVVRSASMVSANWDQYRGRVLKDIYLPVARREPDGPNWLRQYFLVDLKHPSARPLWDAPEDPHGRVVWSPDGKSVLIGPTFLPTAHADEAGLSGHAVAEVDVSSGRFVELPLPANGPKSGYLPLSWNSNDIVELRQAPAWKDSRVRLKFRKKDGQWKQIAEDPEMGWPQQPVQIILRQDPNMPPVLYAIDTATGRESIIREVDPQLSRRFTLGRVELVHWTATDGRPWTGMLYYPVHYQAGHRFPLVIQTHGYLPRDFSLDGVFATAFAAQPLANRDIAVLQTGDPDTLEGNITGTPQEAPIYMAGFEGGAERLIAQGLADPEKVGIIGFSRTGWLVEYMLTHSHLRVAAAEVADNMDGSYLQYLLAGNALKGSLEADKGTAPFRGGLETWMHEAPGFNADKIVSPLRLEIDSGPVATILDQWEMFSNLRRLRKPVELFVVPHIEHGTHILQNPVQRLASQGGTVDWFCFWLKGEQDPDSSKTDQYARWTELRKLEKQSASVVEELR